MDLFLDTTIQVDRAYKGKERRSEIEQHFQNRKIYTSVYVLDQYKNTVVNSVILYYNLLADEATKSPVEAFRRSRVFKNIPIARGRLTKRVQSRIDDIFATLIEQFGNDKNAVLDRLVLACIS